MQPHTKIPKIMALMTAFPYHVDSQILLSDAQALMQEKQIHHLVVTREDGSYGLISERDLQHHLALYGGEIAPELVVNDICVNAVICADINDPVDKVLDVMAERHLGSVVVLKEGELAGIFTTTDACRHFAKHLRDHKPHDDGPDLIA